METTDPLAQRLYMLKKMTSMPMLAGAIVHQVIESILQGLRKGQHIAPEAAEQETINRFRAAWRESSHGEWKAAPSKKTHLFEHYYGVDLSEPYRQSIKAMMIDSVRGFYESDPYVNVLLPSPGSVLTMEQLKTFMLDGTKVYVKLDCAVRQGSNILIYDWKTGKWGDVDDLQLGVYALSAHEMWDVDPEALQVWTVHLRGRPVTAMTREADIESTRFAFLDSVAAMQGCLENPQLNIASMDSFPMTSNIAHCSDCVFREVCHGDTPITSPSTPNSSLSMQETNSVIV